MNLKVEPQPSDPLMTYYPRISESLDAVLQTLKGKKVAVLGHVRPDGDCVGSQVAMARVLNTLGATAICVNQHRVPPMCATFVGDTPFHEVGQIDLDDYVAVSVDCADRKRLGEALQAQFPKIVLNVDHHISNTKYAEHNFIDGGSAAAGEILAGVFIDNAYAIDAITAQALYIGIATDTGQFRFSATTKRTFDLCRALMDFGANPASAAVELYEKESPAKLALLQRFLASFEYRNEGRVCIGILTEADFQETGATKEDTEGLVDYARAIDGVDIGILLEARDALLKGSFRANDPVHRVDVLAKQFNGGGHACAAGFNPESTLAEFYPRLTKALDAHFSNR